MIRHILKVMWNRKRANFLLIVEIFFAFLVLFALFSIGYYNIRNYLRPLGFSYDHVWRMEVINYGINNGDEEAQNRILDQLKTAIAALDEVKHVARGGSNTPYSNSTWTTNSSYTEDQREISFAAHYGAVDEDFHKVWDLTLMEGRWFNEADAVDHLMPVVLSQSLRKHIYGNGKALGKPFNRRYRVVGVFSDYRYRGEFHQPFHFYFVPKIDAHEVNGTFTIRTRPGVGAEFEETLYSLFTRNAKSWNAVIHLVEHMRERYWKRTLGPVISLGIVAGFLLLNVALGIFGVFWYSITRRRPEIGLRKALGANASGISLHIIGEALALTTFGVLIGYLIVVQFPLLNVMNVTADVYVLGMLLASLLMYAIVAACALYPGTLAARIKPAVALHDEG